ncbi:MAG: sulfatase-like hydrolase/transferase [Planctomycetaceae bacterium]|nr:sulfatase-like hydrolase/transferase [Planctomycetaceae bacterium]
MFPSCCLGWLVSLSLVQTAPAERPNILWLTSEDNSPYLGCYGDHLAKTPNLDRFASRGVRYRLAFSGAPVCSTARSTLLMGLHATSLGLHNHRSAVALPKQFVPFPQLLRDAGYYCTNNSKTDYNFATSGKRSPTFMWDVSSPRAHYRNRQPGQPFFAVFNSTTSHESQTTDEAFSKPPLRDQPRVISPGQIVLPPYHPDTPILRENWSRYYQRITQMDAEIGQHLDELEASGQADNTIVFYFSDHGGALPRGKRNVHDSGTRVPLIVFFPPKWQHLAPAKPGEWCDDMVSFTDFAATVLNLAETPIPEWMEGRPFLGANRASPSEAVYLFRGRMDERTDVVRAIRTADTLYVKNFSPHRPYGQHYTYPFTVMPSMQSWFDEYQAGRCNAAQRVYWEPKPSEEFYVTTDDPFQINNLIDSADHQAAIQSARTRLRETLLRTHDVGLIPEGLAERLSEKRTWYDVVHSSDYPAERVLDAAWRGSSRGVPLDDRRSDLTHPHPVIRYWGVKGLLVDIDHAKQLRDPLLAALNDDSFEVRAIAAEALGHLGEAGSALSALANIARKGNDAEVLAALTALETLTVNGWITPDAALAAAGTRPAEPAERIYKLLESRR